MKVVPLLILAAGLALPAFATATGAGVPLEKVGACTQQANQDGLAGTSRDAFMARCTAPATIHKVSYIGTIPDELRMGCEQGANARGLVDQARDNWMRDCTAHRNVQALTMPAVPLAKINACVGSMNARGLSGTQGDAYVRACIAG